MRLLHEIQAYHPDNEQESTDKHQMLQYLMQNPKCIYRDDKIAHFTASAWTLNRERTKALMVYHNLYDSWSWIGGHADGEEDLSSAAMRELGEETGLRKAELVSPSIFSLEILTVNGHEKHGVYVPSHLHFNLTYLACADETELLVVNPKENKAVKWMTFEELLHESSEPWMIERIYRKLIDKSKR